MTNLTAILKDVIKELELYCFTTKRDIERIISRHLNCLLSGFIFAGVIERRQATEEYLKEVMEVLLVNGCKVESAIINGRAETFYYIA